MGARSAVTEPLKGHPPVANGRGRTGAPNVRSLHVGVGRMLPIVQAPDCVPALKAIGEETRVRIVELLLEKALGVDEIAEKLEVSQYNVSKHLRILREAGLLIVEKHGRRRLYALPDDIRRQSDARGHVLDLGCCSFQFDHRPKSAPAARSRTKAR
jgi:DNA-binding transcriptional ArsR family regulator